MVAEILEGVCRFDEKAVSRFLNVHRLALNRPPAQFTTYLPAVYPWVTDLLSREVAPEVRQALQTYFVRVGYTQGFIEHSP